jgi:hypothetical protein
MNFMEGNTIMETRMNASLSTFYEISMELEVHIYNVSMPLGS